MKPENNTVTIKHRCQACGDEYEDRNEAVECFQSHTRFLGEMIECVVYDAETDHESK